MQSFEIRWKRRIPNEKNSFFDIDGTLTSEIDGSIPQSAITAIRKARANGNLMFLNTGRCIQNVEPRFQEVGFDGFVCGCGTDIYCGGKNLLHVTQSHEITMELLKAARDTNVDIVFESSTAVAYDPVRPVIHPDAVAQYDAFVKRGYTMPTDLESPDFTVINLLSGFRTKSSCRLSERSATYISTALTGAAHSGNLSLTATAKQPESSLSLIITICQKRMPMHSGDSNNDLPMLSYLPNSVAMGNADPASLFDRVSFVTKKSERRRYRLRSGTFFLSLGLHPAALFL